MTYIFLAAHYPAPGEQNEVRESMTRMAAMMAGTPAPLVPSDGLA